MDRRDGQNPGITISREVIPGLAGVGGKPARDAPNASVTREEREMKALMRYKIVSGRVVEKRDVLMDVSLDPTTRRPRPRGKRRGKSAASQVERNLREAVKRLARVLNCNFQGGDLFLSLKYSDERLPAAKEEAKREVRNFVRRIARAYRAATGKKLRWALVTADRSSKTGKPVRLHHHVVMDAVDWALIARHWPADQFSYRRLDGSGDYTAIARYMIMNAGYAGHGVPGEAQRSGFAGEEEGQGSGAKGGRKAAKSKADFGPTRTWSTSQGLEKPVYTAPEPVKGAGRFQVPKDARVVEREVREDEESGFHAAYIRYVMAERTDPSVTAKPPVGAGPGPAEGGTPGVRRDKRFGPQGQNLDAGRIHSARADKKTGAPARREPGGEVFLDTARRTGAGATTIGNSPPGRDGGPPGEAQQSGFGGETAQPLEVKPTYGWGVPPAGETNPGASEPRRKRRGE